MVAKATAPVYITLHPNSLQYPALIAWSAESSKNQVWSCTRATSWKRKTRGGQLGHSFCYSLTRLNREDLLYRLQYSGPNRDRMDLQIDYLDLVCIQIKISFVTIWIAVVLRCERLFDSGQTRGFQWRASSHGTIVFASQNVSCSQRCHQGNTRFAVQRAGIGSSRPNLAEPTSDHHPRARSTPTGIW